MRKILILANNDVGLYKFRKELIQELIKRGNEVYISLPYGEFIQPLLEMGCKFFDTPINRRSISITKDFKLMIYYFILLRKLKPDLVVTYTIKPNIYGGIAARINRMPYVINITGLGTAFQNISLLNKLIISLYKSACKGVKLVFFENEENRNIFIHNNIIIREKTCKLNGAGVNLEEYKYFKYPKKNSELHFLFIGRIMKEKGIDELFEVAKCIKNKYKDIYFDIVGPFEEDYKQIIHDLEQKKIIRYFGYQSDVRPYIKNSHCFILPSYHEGMANTLLECASMGRPLITSDIHGCKEAVNGKNGYLVKIKNSQDLYEKIVEFINLPYEYKVSMAIESRKHMENIFNKNSVIEKTIKHLL